MSSSATSWNHTSTEANSPAEHLTSIAINPAKLVI